MAYLAGRPGKLHKGSAKRKKPDCAPSIRARFDKVNRAYAEKMQSRNLLCKKCYPRGILPDQKG